ncbi:MAG: D-alanyl-D-alanine carboxypeptidase, partial [Vallitaleaceae bacterium]|nr:D-alanyl-D-alanine carboxypeptidase [Vallitaleaceae bacterium]
ASITKLMTALLAFENLKPTDTMTFSQTAVFSIEFGSSHIGMQEGETITIDQALHGLLLMSANEVANGLAEKISGSLEDFAIKMNKRAIELGAKDTQFLNANGLYDENHYTTPYDMALIAKELLKYDYFLDIMNDFTYEIPPTNKVDEIRYLSQHHKMLNPKKDQTIFRADVIGGKTGYTNEAGHTLVTISRKENQTLIAVVMKAEGANMYTDTNALMDYGFDNYKLITIAASDYKETIPITKDQERIGEAIVTLKSPINLSVKKDFNSAIAYKVNIDTPLTNDIKPGDIVGTVSLNAGTQLLAEVGVVLEKLTLNNTEATPPVVEKKKPSILLILFILALIAFCFSGLYYYWIINKEKSSINKEKSRTIPLRRPSGASQGHYSKYASKKR